MEKVRTIFKIRDFVSVSKSKHFDGIDSMDQYEKLVDVLAEKLPDRYPNNKASKESLVNEIVKMDIFYQREMSSILYKDIFEVLNLSFEKYEGSITRIPSSSNNEIKYPSAKISKSEDQINNNLKVQQMTAEKLREMYPDACNIIFKAGMRAGAEAQQGAEALELDEFNAKLDKLL